MPNLNRAESPSQHQFPLSVQEDLVTALLACARAVPRGKKAQAMINDAKHLQQGDVKPTLSRIAAYIGAALKHGRIDEARAVIRVLETHVEAHAPALPSDYRGLRFLETKLQGEIDLLQMQRDQGDRSQATCLRLASLYKEYARVTDALQHHDSRDCLRSVA